MTNFRFWGRFRYSCSLPASFPPGNLKAAASSASKLCHQFQVLGCVFCGIFDSLPLLQHQPRPQNQREHPQNTFLSCLHTQHSLQPEKQMLQKLPIADTQIKQFFSFFNISQGCFQRSLQAWLDCDKWQTSSELAGAEGAALSVQHEKLNAQFQTNLAHADSCLSGRKALFNHKIQIHHLIQ